MYKLSLLCVFLTLWLGLHVFTPTVSGQFTNRWAVHVTAGENVARQIAEENGFRYVTKVCVLKRYFYVL